MALFRHARCAGLITAILLLLAPVAGRAQDATTAEPVLSAPAKMIESTLYFGLSNEDGSGVSEQAWNSFLQTSVTQAFPNGLTVMEAYGQYRSPGAVEVVREATKMLIIVHPDTDEAAAALNAIKRDYRDNFSHADVFHTRASVEVVSPFPAAKPAAE